MPQRNEASRLGPLIDTMRAHPGDDHRLDDVAAAAGFGTAAAMRHHFRARLGISPSAYRGAFAAAARTA